jgi:hypothetical protein
MRGINKKNISSVVQEEDMEFEEEEDDEQDMTAQ